MSRFRVRVTGEGQPLSGVLISRDTGSGWDLVGKTDDKGVQAWDVDPDILPLKLLFEPPRRFWPRPLAFAEADGEAEVQLEPLPRKGPTAWWHRCLGPSAGSPEAGNGIRVGVVDTGAGPSPCLGHVLAAGAWLGGGFTGGDDASHDIRSHGTHVAGLITARACHETDYVGIAPGVTAVVARIFSKARPYASHDDLANAIEGLVENHGVHLISLSLGSHKKVRVDHDAILDAIDAGTAVLAASGNDNRKVQFPAAYEGVIAVGALGKLDEGSELARGGIYVAAGEPFDDSEGLYPADFACSGPEVACTAPGVEVISTVPSLTGAECEFGVMTGTSMATPIACAALAILLSRDREYLEMPATRERAAYAARVLREACRDLGFPKPRQGAGLPAVG